MAELPAMTQPPNDTNKIPNIPAAEPMHQSFSSPTLPTPNMPDNNNMNNTINDPMAAAKIPSLQSNMFKMQRKQTLKKSYVDVFNPSGAAPKNDTPILAPMMPTLPTQPTFFVPANLPNNNQQSVSNFTYFSL